VTIKRRAKDKDKKEEKTSTILLSRERAVYPPLAILGDEGDRREKNLFVFERSEFKQIPGGRLKSR
jgi:hypothetical protein